MAAGAAHGEHKHIRRCHHRPWPRGDAAHVVLRVYMQAKDGVHPFQRAFFDHAHPTGFALFVGGFFAGLEQQPHRTGQPSLGSQFLEDRSGPQQHGCVSIVAAGVHDPRPRASIVLGADFLDGQRVHIGAQGHQRPIPAANVAEDARLGDFRLGADAGIHQHGIDE